LNDLGLIHGTQRGDLALDADALDQCLMLISQRSVTDDTEINIVTPGRAAAARRAADPLPHDQAADRRQPRAPIRPPAAWAMARPSRCPDSRCNSSRTRCGPVASPAARKSAPKASTACWRASVAVRHVLVRDSSTRARLPGASRSEPLHDRPKRTGSYSALTYRLPRPNPEFPKLYPKPNASLVTIVHIRCHLTDTFPARVRRTTGFGSRTWCQGKQELK
jgi:hypothetical protein